MNSSSFNNFIIFIHPSFTCYTYTLPFQKAVKTTSIFYMYTFFYPHKSYLIGCILSHMPGSLCRTLSYERWQLDCLCSFPWQTSCPLICTAHHCLMMDDGTSTLTGSLGKFIFSLPCFWLLLFFFLYPTAVHGTLIQQSSFVMS